MISLHDPVAKTAVLSPFKLLDYYVEADADIFGGRDQEIFDITARLASRGILVLYGPAGIGKTSLIQAGVFPCVRRLGWSCVYVRTLTNPLVDMTTAMGEQLSSTINYSSDLTEIIETIAAIAKNAPLLIAFDQFEEFFIRFENNADLRNAFISVIAGVARRNEIDCRILFSLREDYFAKLDEFRQKLPIIFDHSYRLGPLSAFGARQAFTRPLRRSDISFDSRLTSDLLEDFAKVNFDPALLQIVCNELVRVASERDPKTIKITSADLHAFGGIEGVFQLYLENAIHELAPESRLLARLVLDALITQERTKQAMRVNDLLRQQFVTTTEELAAILAILSKFHIIRRDTRGYEEWFELVHERLVPIVQQWILADWDYLRFVTAHDSVKFAGKTEVLRKNPEALLNRGQIEDIVGPYAGRLRFDPERVEFILWSCVYRNSPALIYWAERYGRERTMEVLLAAMSSATDAMRWGALAAINRFDCAPSRKIIEMCLHLSLKDPSEAVRRMAGVAFGRHGEERDLAELRTTLQRDETRARALEVYADMPSSARVKRSIGLFAAFQARRIAHQRQFRNYRELRLRRANLGSLYGVATGVVWSLTIVPLFLFTNVFVEGPQYDTLMGLAVAMAIVFPLTCLLGALLGRTFAVSAARHDVLQRPESWSFDLLFARGSWVIVLIYIVAVALVAVLGVPDSIDMRWFFVWTMMPLVYWIVTPPLATAIARECLGGNYGLAAIVWWGGFAAAVIPAFLAAATLYIGYSLLNAPLPESFYALWSFLTVLGTTVAAVALSALALPRIRLPFQPLEDQPHPAV
jgi:hypothetical protein